MNRGWVARAALAAAVFGALCMGAAYAQTAAPDAPDAPAQPVASDAAAAPAKMKPKPKAAAPRGAKPPSIAIVVVNRRSVGLVELTAGQSGADPVKIAGPLAAGKKVVAHVARGKACLFDLHGAFADDAETETNSYDLCKNKTIVLVD